MHKFAFHWSSYLKIDFNLDLKVQSNQRLRKKNCINWLITFVDPSFTPIDDTSETDHTTQAIHKEQNNSRFVLWIRQNVWTPVVNFINVFRAFFSYKILAPSQT